MITIPVSVGELIDKLSILHVKKIKITNLEKLVYVNKEFELLYNFSSDYLNDEEITKLYHELNGGSMYGRIKIIKLPDDKDTADLRGQVDEYYYKMRG